MFFRKSKKRPENSVKARCAALDGKSLRCVSERTDGIETIIARQGMFAFRDGYLLIYADGADPIQMPAGRNGSRGANVIGGNCNNGTRLYVRGQKQNGRCLL